MFRLDFVFLAHGYGGKAVLNPKSLFSGRPNPNHGSSALVCALRRGPLRYPVNTQNTRAHTSEPLKGVGGKGPARAHATARSYPQRDSSCKLVPSRDTGP